MDFHVLQTFITAQKGVSPVKYWRATREGAEEEKLNVVNEELKVSLIFFLQIFLRQQSPPN